MLLQLRLVSAIKPQLLFRVALTAERNIFQNMNGGRNIEKAALNRVFSLPNSHNNFLNVPILEKFIKLELGSYLKGVSALYIFLQKQKLDLTLILQQLRIRCQCRFHVYLDLQTLNLKRFELLSYYSHQFNYEQAAFYRV